MKILLILSLLLLSACPIKDKKIAPEPDTYTKSEYIDTQDSQNDI
jgi:hypothetical protein